MATEMNKQRIEVAPTYDLSDFDKAYMMINYPHNTSHLSALQLAWTLEHAVQIAGVNWSTADDIFAAQDDPATTPALFAASQLSVRPKAQRRVFASWEGNLRRRS